MITKNHIGQILQLIVTEFQDGYQNRTIEAPPGYQGMALKAAILSADAGSLAAAVTGALPESIVDKINAVLGGGEHADQSPTGADSSEPLHRDERIGQDVRPAQAP